MKVLSVGGFGGRGYHVRQTSLALGEDLRQKTLTLANSLDLNGDRVHCPRDLTGLTPQPSFQFLSRHHAGGGSAGVSEPEALCPETKEEGQQCMACGMPGGLARLNSVPDGNNVDEREQRCHHYPRSMLEPHVFLLVSGLTHTS